MYRNFIMQNQLTKNQTN